MEKDNFNNSEETTKTTSRQSFLKFVLAFLILIIGAVGYLVWSRNYSKNARLYRQNQESLEKYNKFISSFEAAVVGRSLAAVTGIVAMVLPAAVMAQETIILLGSNSVK